MMDLDLSDNLGFGIFLGIVACVALLGAAAWGMDTGRRDVCERVTRELTLANLSQAVTALRAAGTCPELLK